MSENNLQDWVGRQERVSEFISASHAKKIAFSVNAPMPVDGEYLPLLWHWAYFIDPMPLDELGDDGHPARGGFLPPADNRNRMWAGGRLTFVSDMVIGKEAERITTIKAVVEKEGRTGKLLFVTLEHVYEQEGKICIIEEQDIVYREPSPPKLVGDEPAPEAEWSQEVEPNSVMLFRYSAVTFNGHRIHYDYPYANGVEGYPGLVVHGPLIATKVLQAFTEEHPEKLVTQFSFRGVRPLIGPEPFKVEGAVVELNSAKLWAQQGGTVAQKAEIQFM
ncbi:MAG: itaconyl-CoA hydratase [Alcaligenaceae bacterium]|nr:itaconyl-CoA hydratase [Alcaligenaceae bacterium]